MRVCEGFENGLRRCCQTYAKGNWLAKGLQSVCETFAKDLQRVCERVAGPRSVRKALSKGLRRVCEGLRGVCEGFATGLRSVCESCSKCLVGQVSTFFVLVVLKLMSHESSSLFFVLPQMLGNIGNRSWHVFKNSWALFSKHSVGLLFDVRVSLFF